MTPEPLSASARAPEMQGTTSTTRTTLASLVLVYAFNFMDRQLVAALVLPCALVGFQLGPSYAIVQSLVASSARSVAAALLLLFVNLLGLGLGPLIVGSLSDALRPSLGDEALRYALLIMPVLGFWAVLHYRAAGRWLALEGSEASVERR